MGYNLFNLRECMVFPAMTENSPSPSSWASDRWSRAGTKGSWTCASGRRGSWPYLLSWRTATAVPAMSSLAVSHPSLTRARGMMGRVSGGESRSVSISIQATLPLSDFPKLKFFLHLGFILFYLNSMKDRRFWFSSWAKIYLVSHKKIINLIILFM